MAKVDITKTVYNKAQFNRVVGGREFTTFTLDGGGVSFTVEDFFAEYENLFLSIPINGPSNSHEYLVRKSGELVGFQRTTEDIQPLLDEIANLREQLLQSRQENVNLQIEVAGGTSSSQLTEQFNQLLQALGEQPQVNVNILGDEESDLTTADTTEEDTTEEDTTVTEETVIGDNPPELDFDYILNYGIDVFEAPGKAFSPYVEGAPITTEFKLEFPYIKDPDEDVIGVTEILGQPFPAPDGTLVELVDPELITITVPPVGSSFLTENKFDSTFRVRISDSRGNTVETNLGIKFKIEI